jgi:hypothetical protein
MSLSTFLQTVEHQTTVDKSIRALNAAYKAELKAAGTDPVKLKALQDMFDEHDKIAARSCREYASSRAS